MILDTRRDSIMTGTYQASRIFITAVLTLSGLSLLAPSRTMAQQPAPSKPIAITDQDLQQLSPDARKELLELIEYKRQNPDPKPGQIRFKEQGIVEGDIGPGGVNIKLLGGAIQIGGKNKRRPPEPKPIANYHPPGVPVYPEDLIITMIKRGNDPLVITLQRGSFSITMTGEQIEQMIDKYKPYVVQMLRQALEQSGESDMTPEPRPSIDLGAPSSDLGEPSELPESDLGKPSELPGPDLGSPSPPKPGKDETLKEKEAPKE